MKVKFRIWKSISEGDPFPFQLQERVKSMYSSWWKVRYEWNARGSFKTLEEAEERIKKLVKPPYQYDESGKRIS